MRWCLRAERPEAAHYSAGFLSRSSGGGQDRAALACEYSGAPRVADPWHRMPGAWLRPWARRSGRDRVTAPQLGLG